MKKKRLKGKESRTFMLTHYLVGEDVQITFHWCGFFQSKELWQHEERRNPDYELMIGVEGVMHLEIEGKAVDLVPGMLLIIPPKAHFFGRKKSAQVRFYWLHFSATNLKTVSSLDKRATWCLPLASQQLLMDNEIALLQQLQTVKQQAYADNPLLNAYARTLLLSINEKQRALAMPKTTTHYLIEHVKNFLQSNYQNTLSVSAVANYFGYNQAYLSHLFAKEVGQSMTSYLIGIRLEAARQQLLTSVDSIEAVSNACGFEDSKYFSRVFSKQYGKSPRAYRQEKGQINQM